MKQPPTTAKLSVPRLIAVLAASSFTLQAIAVEECYTSNAKWTPPTGLTTLNELIVIGSGAAGGKSSTNEFGPSGSAAPNGGNPGTGWGAGGGAGKLAAGGGAGLVITQTNVPVSTDVTIVAGKAATLPGQNGNQSCFGSICANGGAGGKSLPAGEFGLGLGGFAGYLGSNGVTDSTTSAATINGYVSTTTGATYTFRNASPNSLKVTGVSVTPSPAQQTGGTCVPGLTLAPDAACTVSWSTTVSTEGTHIYYIKVSSAVGSDIAQVAFNAGTIPGCALPWGGNIASGQTVNAYATTSVPFGSNCTAQARTCSYGSLSGSYTNSSCSVQAPANCTSPWGATVVNGNGVTAYAASTVPYGSSCVAQTRSCSNGSLSGSYTSQSCTVQAPASCTSPWGSTLASGSSVTAYANSSVPYGSSCAGESRSCANGSLSGSYTYQSCTVQTPAACSGGPLSWGGGCTGSVATTPSGSNATASNTATGFTGNISGSCSNGSWTITSQTCAATTCSLPWGGTISNGQSVTAYQAGSAAYNSPQTCTSVATQTRTCSNGTLSGSYQFGSCKNDCSNWIVTPFNGEAKTCYQCAGDSAPKCVVEGYCTNGHCVYR